MFLHERTTALSFSNLSAPDLLLSRIPQCTSLRSLDLSTHLSLNDSALAKILAQLKSLEKINLRGCTKVGDSSTIALSKGTESRLLEVNLSLTAVTVKGLTSLLARCSAIEVLKLSNVQGLVSASSADSHVFVLTGPAVFRMAPRSTSWSMIRLVQLSVGATCLYQI